MADYKFDGGIEGVGPLSPFLVDFLEGSEDLKLILGHVIDQNGALRLGHPDVQNALMAVIQKDLAKRLKARYEDKDECCKKGKNSK